MIVDYIYPPKKGWEEETWYLVEVAFSKYNVIHKSLFYTGFLNGMPHRKFPGNYNILVNPTYDLNYKISDIYYMRVIKKLLSTKNFYKEHIKLPDDMIKKLGSNF